MNVINILGIIRDTNKHEMDAVQYYRTYLPLREVNRSAEGIVAQCVDFETVATDGGSKALWGGRDIYAMCRMYHGDCQEFIARVHRCGGVLVLDSDDDLTEDYRLVSGNGRAFKTMLGAVDYVTVSTPALANHFGQYTKRRPTVLKNHVDTDWMVEVSGKAKRIMEGLIIGFSGSPTHWGDWYLPAVPFARIARDFDVVPMLHGEMPRYLNHAADDLVKLGGVPFAIYPVLLSQFDILLCAVDSDDQFNSGKSAVKALEAMAVGAVPICSRFGPYQELAEAGAPIVIIEEESRDGWYEAMRSVITDEHWRKTLAESGLDWVRENRDMVRQGYEDWETFYHAIAN